MTQKPLRVRIVGSGPTADNLRVINLETGEEINNIFNLAFEADASTGLVLLNLTIADFEIDTEADAVVEETTMDEILEDFQQSLLN